MRRVFWILVAGLMLSAILLPLSASAQQGSDEPTVIYQRTTIYNVTEGDVIEAPINRPDIGVVDGHPGTTHASLIKVRENMNEKVMASVSEL